MQGTIQWSAPELFHGTTANYFTDMYAVGVIFWELAFCEVPFQNKNHAILMSLIEKGLTPEIPNPLPPCAAGFPPAFFDIMRQCWAPRSALLPTMCTGFWFPSTPPPAPVRRSCTTPSTTPFPPPLSSTVCAAPCRRLHTPCWPG